MGPGAGVHGGEIVAQGSARDIERAEGSLTGQYLSGRRAIAVPRRRNRPDPDPAHSLRLRGAQEQLKGVDLALPVELFVCVTGVSGSGKSALVNDTLYAAVARRLHQGRRGARGARRDRGPGALRQGDQRRPRARSAARRARTRPHLHRGLFAPIRDLFAGTPEARTWRLRARPLLVQRQGRALRGVPGRRRHRGGDAPRALSTCPRRHGRRYNPRGNMEIRYKGRGIRDVLEMTVEQAHNEFFDAVPPCPEARDAGGRRGYIKLSGQRPRSRAARRSA
ncbi:MAG: hypothetical protein U1F45_02005 [Burkholderiales bacterium]